MDQEEGGGGERGGEVIFQKGNRRIWNRSGVRFLTSNSGPWALIANSSSVGMRVEQPRARERQGAPKPTLVIGPLTGEIETREE